MLKTSTNVGNENYEIQPINTHYIKRIEKINEEEVYFCIEKSSDLSIDALKSHMKNSEKAMKIIGRKNTRATLIDLGRGFYQVTIIYFEKSFNTLMSATKHLNLLGEKEASDYILPY